MMGNQVELQFPPKRIVSLVPSQTELLYDLGLRDEVVGITKFCVHPNDWFRSKTRIGGTKQLNLNKIRLLKPDLIIANKEENDKQQVEALLADTPVWISDIKTVDDALEMIRRVGEIVDRKAAGEQIADSIGKGFAELPKSTEIKKVAYLIWYQPWMAAGNDTFIHHMLTSLGWQNVYDTEARYPETDLHKLKDKSPDIVLLSSEPFPFKEKHIAIIREVLPNTEIQLVDGEMFSWYGSRMIKAVSYFQGMLERNS